MQRSPATQATPSGLLCNIHLADMQRSLATKAAPHHSFEAQKEIR